MKKCFFLAFALTLFFSQNIDSQNVRLVKDVIGGVEGGFQPEDTKLLAGLDSFLIFIAAGKGGSRLVCASNGKPNNAYPVISPLASNETFGGHAQVGNLCYFIVNKALKAELYVTDGTIAGTQVKHSLANGKFSKIQKFQDGVVFHEQVSSNFEDRLMRFSEAGGVTKLADFHWFSGILDLTTTDSAIWGIGSVGSSNRYLFRSNGTPGNLETPVLLNTGSEFNQHIFMTPVGKRVFFFFQKNNEPYKLWVSDGTPTGTLGLAEFEVPFFDDLRASRGVAVFQDKFFFQGKTTTGAHSIWMSDGTIAGTQSIKGLAAFDSEPKNMTVWNGKLWFSAQNNAGNSELWSNDGTVGGNKKVLHSFAWNEYNGLDINVFHDSLAFTGYKLNRGEELMFCLGDDASLRIVSDAPDEYFSPKNYIATAKHLFFTAKTPSLGRELWCYAPHEKAVVPTSESQFFAAAKIFPNPGDDVLTLETEAEGVAQIFSTEGKLLLEQPVVEGLNSLKTSSLEGGFYLVRVRGAEGFRVFSWVKN